MIEERKKYYPAMIEKNRLMPIIVDGRWAAFITFYITNNIHEYDNKDPWGIFEDNPDGSICYINQMMTDMHKDNKNFSFCALSNFKIFIKNKFPNVKYIFWRRWDKNKSIIKIYKKEI